MLASAEPGGPARWPRSGVRPSMAEPAGSDGCRYAFGSRGLGGRHRSRGCELRDSGHFL